MGVTAPWGHVNADADRVETWTHAHGWLIISLQQSAREKPRVANTKSAIKQIRVSERKRQRNRPIKTRIKNAVVKAVASIAGTAASSDSLEAVADAISQLDRAASKGVIHANNAARRKSRLMKKLNAARATA
jgi:small subunit ribosomal protein S20